MRVYVSAASCHTALRLALSHMPSSIISRADTRRCLAQHMMLYQYEMSCYSYVPMSVGNAIKGAVEFCQCKCCQCDWSLGWKAKSYLPRSLMGTSTSRS